MLRNSGIKTSLCAWTLGLLIIARYSHAHEMVVAVSTLAMLHKSCLRLQDLQSLFQSLDLSFTASFTLLVCLWLGNAAILDFAVISRTAESSVLVLSLSAESS